MKQLLILLFCGVTLFSCYSKNKVPDAIIQPDKMGNVLWDVMRMQFLAEEVASSDSSVNKEEEIKKLTEKVFKIHKVTSVKFDKSYDWYIKHPELLKRIFDSIQVQKQRIHDAPEVSEDMPDPGPMRNRFKGKERELMKEVE